MITISMVRLANAFHCSCDIRSPNSLLFFVKIVLSFLFRSHLYLQGSETVWDWKGARSQMSSDISSLRWHHHHHHHDHHHHHHGHRYCHHRGHHQHHWHHYCHHHQLQLQPCQMRLIVTELRDDMLLQVVNWSPSSLSSSASSPSSTSPLSTSATSSWRPFSTGRRLHCQCKWRGRRDRQT